MPQPRAEGTQPVTVTMDPLALVADKTGEVQWFPTRVTDLLHEAGGFGHRSGICHACTAVYTAINVVMGEVDASVTRMDELSEARAASSGTVGPE